MAEPGRHGTAAESSANDLETLLGTGIGAAREQLERHGGFLPFALLVENDGGIRLLTVAPVTPGSGAEAEVSGAEGAAPGTDAGGRTEGGNELGAGTSFDAEAMLDDLTELLRQNRGECRAAALVCDIILPEEDSEAIHVAAEHCDGSVLAAVLPYRPQPDGRWEFGEPAADTHEPVIWVD